MSRLSSLGLLSSRASIIAVMSACSITSVSAREVRFDIPAQRVDSALQAFAKQSGYRLLYPTDDIQKLKSTPLKGVLSVDDALKALLDGTPLQVASVKDRIIALTLRAKPEARLRRASIVRTPPIQLSSLGAPPVGVLSSVAASAAAVPEEAAEITVTGSRIKRIDSRSDQPIQVIDGSADIEGRGYVNAAQAINELPQVGVPDTGRGAVQSANIGRNFVNLFGLGSQRTLTLVNGRRFVSSNPGQPGSINPGSQVDLNAIPAALIKTIDVVQATGSATYGSDAIAGVVNVVLKDDFNGIELDGQSGISSRGDARAIAARITAGTDFAQSRGNITVSYEHTETGGINGSSRPFFANQYGLVPNSADTSRTDGIPASVLISGRRIPVFASSGIPFKIGSTSMSGIITIPDPSNLAATVPATFDGNGNLVPYNTGQIRTLTSAIGGDGFNVAEYMSLSAPVKRDIVYSNMHYDLTDQIRLSGEFSGSWVQGSLDAAQNASATNSFSNGNGATGAYVISTADNAFLSQTSKNALLSQGIDSFLVNKFNSQFTTMPGQSNVRTLRSFVGVDGKFDIGDKHYYWSVGGSYGKTTGKVRRTNVISNRLRYGVDAVYGADGTIMCRILRDNPTSTNPVIAGCKPLNIFGVDSISQEGLDYVLTEFVQTYSLEQKNMLANIGGDLFDLPGGRLAFSLGYEHREEKTESSGNEAALSGIGFEAVTVPMKGKYNTDEIYGELLLPIVGGDFTLPLVQKFEVEAAARHTNNSLVGNDYAWNVGAKWTVVDGLTIRSSRSRTFRAPSTVELFSPAATLSNSVSIDPCDQRNIGGGSNPAARTRNCQAMFNSLGLPSNYQLISNAQNVGVQVLQSGSPDLKNEVANSLTVGAVASPSFIPGLTLSADYIDIKINDAIVNLNLSTIVLTCFDADSPSSAVCDRVVRNDQAQITGGQTGFVNAGFTNFRGFSYSADYTIRLGTILSSGDPAKLNLHADVFNNKRLQTSVSGLGFDLDETAGEINAPKWKVQARATYTQGPASLSWFTTYQSPSEYNLLFTIEDRALLKTSAYWRHDMSFKYDIGKFTFRGGVNNVFDRMPDPLSTGLFAADGSYDIVGRFMYIGAKVKF